MAQRLREQDGIETVRANQQVGSLTIAFDEGIVSLSQLKEQLQTWGKLPALDSPSIPENATSWKERGSQAWTQMQSFVPLIVGLAATKGLKLQGWKAIAAYILSANLTREILEQLAPENSEPSEKEGDRPKIVSQPLPEDSPSYSIVHAVPGRMRLRILQLRQNADFAKKLERLPAIDDRVTQVRINYTTGSVVITYVPAVSSNTQNGKNPSSTSWLIDLVESIAVPETSEEEEESSSDPDKSDRAVGNADENKEENDPDDSDASNSIAIDPSNAVEPLATLKQAEKSPSLKRLTSEAAIELTPLSIQENPSYWFDFKSCAMKMMLALMANPSLQTARVSGS